MKKQQNQTSQGRQPPPQQRNVQQQQKKTTNTVKTVETFGPPDKQKLYQNFKQQEKDLLQKTGVILSTVYYLLDHKSIAYKLECDVDYLMTFLNKREDASKAESINLLHKLCVNQDVQNLLLKDSNFQQLVIICNESPIEEIRSSCYGIFGTLALINPSKQVIKQLFFQHKIIEDIITRMRSEQSEDVLCSILQFLMKLTSDDLYLELVTQNLQIVQEIISLMNYKRNQKLKRLAYAITVNLLCEEELRRALMNQQTSVDVISKLIGVLNQSIPEQQDKQLYRVTKEETITALKALSNALQDNMLFLSFLQQKGHVALSEVFEDEDLRVKEASLCLYVRLAQDKDNNIQIVLEADLIYDVLSLDVNENQNLGVMRNMLVLVGVMLTTQNVKALEQMKQFDLIGVLLHIISNSTILGYLALSCLGLLANIEFFKQKLEDKNLSQSILDTIMKCLQMHEDQNTQEFKFTLRGIQILLLSFQEIDYKILEVDILISFIQVLNDLYENIEDSTSQFYAILILKRLNEMGDKQISEIILSLEQFAQQINDAPSLDYYQQNGFVVEIIEKDIMKHMIFYKGDVDVDQGYEQKILFHSDLSKQIQDNSQLDKHQQEINQLKLKEQNLVNYINEVESEKARLEEEIKTLIGKQKIDYLSDRIIELEQDLQIRDKALQKLTQGTQLAEVIGSVKDKIRDDLNHKFVNLQTHIKSLEGVIDTNSKLIKDLSEAIQERNLENTSLKNEDKLKQGKIETLQNKITTLEKQVQEQQKKETQLRVVIEKMIQEKEQHFKEVQIQLPNLQLSTEQVMISELQEQLIHFKVDNLKLEEEVRKLENKLKKNEVSQSDMQNELDKFRSQLDLPDTHYILKQIQLNPKSLELTVQNINQALQYIDRNITRHNFKEELLNFYEDKLQQLHDKYEHLLITHFQQQTHLQIAQSQLSQFRLMQPLYQSSSRQNQDLSISDLIDQQWQQTQRHMKRYEDQCKQQMNENKQLIIKVQEVEEQLIQYKKYVMMEQTQYERLFKIKNETPLNQTELGIIGMFLQNQNTSEFQRMSRILDIIIKNNIDLEFKLSLNNSERLRNEYHLIIEQREMEVRKSTSQEIDETKIRKLENLINEIQLDTQAIEVMNKVGNTAQTILGETFEQLNSMSELISQATEESLNFKGQPQKSFKTTKTIKDANKTQDQKTDQKQFQGGQSNNLNKTQDQIVKKKVQTTNLIAIDGKKPRFANDYNKQLKPQLPGTSLTDIIVKLDQTQRDCYVKLSQVQSELNEEQKIRARQASDSLKEISILRGALLKRQEENQDLVNDIKRILLSKNDLTNQLIKKDFIIQSNIGGSLPLPSPSGKGSTKTSPRVQQNQKINPQIQKLEDLTKINNFVRKKEHEAREECDLLKHKIDKFDKERLSLTLENKKLTEQIRYLQQLLKNQREQFRKFGNVNSDKNADNQVDQNAEIPDDDIVKFLVQIDEINQKNSELEYMLQMALQSNIEKEKLMRGTEDLVESINTKVEQISFLIQTQIPTSKQAPKKIDRLPIMPQYSGPDTVFERLNILGLYLNNWFSHITEQVRELQKQKEILETMKPSNQTLTQAEHQAKLEKYLNIYSSRIQTLSSIIASYQRHFKTLEDQIRELQGIPNIQAMNQVPTQRQIENARIESLKRMINLKDILIKHQQNEIELIKKSIIGDKFNENAIYYVSQEEKQAILKMRQFDMQVRLIQDYERQMLMIKEETVKKGEEHIYLQQVNVKIQNDLINVKEVFQTNWNQNKVSVRAGQMNNDQKLNGTQNSKQQEQEITREDNMLKYVEMELEKKEYMQKWLNMIQDLILNQFDVEKCKFYVETLNQELPIILSIMQKSDKHELKELNNEIFDKSQTGFSLETSYLNQRIEELNQESIILNKKLTKYKDHQNFLRSKNQQLQEQNILLKKFLHSKKQMADDFKHFYKQDLLQENQSLRTQILNLTPYNEKLSLEVATLKFNVQDLNHKLLKQDERHLREQELFQNLEQGLLDTQKKLIEKDSETIRMIKAQKETLFRGNQDQALELLINTADTLNQETIRLREQNWQLAQNLKTKRISLELKTSKIKESKGILKQYEEKIRDLTVENEKLKVLKIPVMEGSHSSLLSLQDPSQVNKDKLIYEIGKDGANTVIKFLDEIAHYKDSINNLAHEMQELKVKNTTLLLLVQDKSSKLQNLESQQRQLKKLLLDKDEKIEKLEFMYQKINDDFISQQQALDVYVQMAIPVIGKDQIKAFSRCVDNAKLLAIMLRDVQKQRNYYYESSIFYERKAHLFNQQLKVQDHEYYKVIQKFQLLENERIHNSIQTKINVGIMSRYEKEFSIISKLVQDTSIGIESLIYNNNNQLQIQNDPTLSPKKQNEKKLQDSPKINSVKKGVSSKIDSKIPQNEPVRTINFTDRSSIHILLNSQLEINKLKSVHTQYHNQIKALQIQNWHNQSLVTYLEQSNDQLLDDTNFYKSINSQFLNENNNLKLQNIYLSRMCLYSYRANTIIFKRNDNENQEEVEQLMSQEIDKLKIENRLLQEKQDILEAKLEQIKTLYGHQFEQDSTENQQTQKDKSKPVQSLELSHLRQNQRLKNKIHVLEKELEQQIEWNTQLEQEILSKSAQIQALSKIHNDFSQFTPMQQINQAQTTAAQPNLNSKQQQKQNINQVNGQTMDDPSSLNNLKQEYQKLELNNQKLHERLYLLENKLSQKDQKLQLYQQRIRDVEKQLMAFDYSDSHIVGGANQIENGDNNKIIARQQNQSQKSHGGKELVSNLFISHREIQMQLEIDEIWNKMSDLNSLKNTLYDRNDDLRIEIESFKTHFSKYEAQEFKKRVQGQESFQFHLYNELTTLREERDVLIWQLNKQAARIWDQQSQIEVFRDTLIPSLETQIRQQEEFDIKHQNEIQLMKEQFMQQTMTQIQGHKDFDNIKTMLQLFEGGRLKRDKIHLVYENARLRRENDTLRKDVDNSKKFQDKIVVREFGLKKRLVELKNELVRLRVTYDMGEYQNLVVGKTPSKNVNLVSSNKKLGSQEEQLTYDKVKQYVEDLAVLRESLLKIEFKNIELQETSNKKDLQIEELSQYIKDLQAQLQILNNQPLGSQSGLNDSNYENTFLTYTDPKQTNQKPNLNQTFQSDMHYIDHIELNQQTRQIVDLQQRLMEEQWNASKFKSRVEELEIQNKELLSISEKHYEEIKEHQQLQTQISIMQKQIQDLKRPHQQMEVFQEKSDIVFYDMLKDRFLMYLGLYVDEVRWKNKQLAQAQERNRVNEDQIIRMTIQIQTFSKERDSYKLLIDNLINQKVNQVEQEFVNTAQHEEGLSKMEVHIMNQRKKLVQLKSQLDVSRNECEIKDQNIQAMNEIIRNLEKHSMEYNSELTESKDECVKLRGERERYEQKVAFMWERLDFQQKLHHKVVTNNATLEQVIKVYKDEISKLKAFLHLNNGAIQLQTGMKSIKQVNQAQNQIEITKSYVIKLETDLVKLRNKEQMQTEKIQRLIYEVDDLKSHLRLSDMLRKTVGISAAERQQLTSLYQSKRQKVKDVKMMLLRESKEKEKFKDRVDYLEKQITELRSQLSSAQGHDFVGLKNIGSGFVKAPFSQFENADDSELQNIGPYEAKELLDFNHSLRQQLKEIEAQNFGLKQQILEYEGQIAKMNGETKRASTGLRTVTPIKIRDMQIKSNISGGHIGQRLNSLRQPPQEFHNDFYYGQNTNLDPLSQLKDDIHDAIVERQINQMNQSQYSTKLPKIGNQANMTTIIQQQDIQPLGSNMTQTSSFEKSQQHQRNLTPIHLRGGANNIMKTSFTNNMKGNTNHLQQTSFGDELANDSILINNSNMKPPPRPNYQIKTPLLNKQMGIERNGNSYNDAGLVQYESNAYLQKQNSIHNLGPNLINQGSLSANNQNQFTFKGANNL
eukprot:403342191